MLSRTEKHQKCIFAVIKCTRCHIGSMNGRILIVTELISIDVLAQEEWLVSLGGKINYYGIMDKTDRNRNQKGMDSSTAGLFTWKWTTFRNVTVGQPNKSSDKLGEVLLRSFIKVACSINYCSNQDGRALLDVSNCLVDSRWWRQADIMCLAWLKWIWPIDGVSCRGRIKISTTFLLIDFEKSVGILTIYLDRILKINLRYDQFITTDIQ